MTDHEKAECIRAFSGKFAVRCSEERAKDPTDEAALWGSLILLGIAGLSDAQVLEILNGGESK